MSPPTTSNRPARTVTDLTDRAAVLIGSAIHDERTRRGWTIRHLADRAAVSYAVVQGIEAGRRASLEMYVRLTHALGLRLEAGVIDPRRRPAAARSADPVHAAMGELEAGHMRAIGLPVSLDEPYQHYQFAGRADLVSWSVADRALLHIENRTGFPDLQYAAGSWNAKRAYLAPILADRFRIARGFVSVSHVMVGLWSSEVIHVVRLRSATFRSLCPDPPTAFESWWSGRPPPSGTTSALILLDPFARGRQRLWTDLETAIERADPRVRGYAEAAARLR